MSLPQILASRSTDRSNVEAASIKYGAHDAPHDGGHDEHHGPPEANRSSRVDAPTLGMLLFIISEIMIFGAFFTAYFFIRIVQGDPWPAPGTTIPVAVAAFNTAILISSSFTLHWAETSIKNGNRNGLRAGHPQHAAARRDVPLHPDQRVRPPRLRSAATAPRRRSSTASPACTAPTSASA
jgi:hypothetical protein